MEFTALHRLLGIAHSPLTDSMIEEAVTRGLAETDDLDWKSELPPARGIQNTDFPKDIAAMANRGGGTIVYGVREQAKIATGRCDAGELDEGYERSLRQAAISAITPPVFGLSIHRLGRPGRRAVVVTVAASIDGPHLIYRGEYFGAPIRNDADTVWMRERQIETMYKTRFDERRHATAALDALYTELATGRDTDKRAWLIAVAHPRLPAVRQTRLTREEARRLIEEATKTSLHFAHRGPGAHPLEVIDRFNPRPGLRRWVAPYCLPTSSRWREAHVAIHNDGSVTIAAALGGHRDSIGDHVPGEVIHSYSLESATADLLGMIRAVGVYLSTSEYEIRIGIEWNGPQHLILETLDTSNQPCRDASLPLARYTPVSATVTADTDDQTFREQLAELALDCINQGGISNLRVIRSTNHDDERF